MKRTLKLLLMCLLLFSLGSSVVFAAEAALPEEIAAQEQTVSPDVGQAGETAKEGWTETDSGLYYYVNGRPVTGFFTVGGAKYYADSNGAVKTAGFFYTDGHTYYAQENGVLLSNGKYDIGDETFIFSASGASRTGIVDYMGAKYYCDPDDRGRVVTEPGFKKAASGKTLYIKDETGALAANQKITDGGRTYIFYANASRASGVVKYGSHYYYCNPSKADAIETNVNSYKTAAGKYIYVKNASGELVANQKFTYGGNTYIYLSNATRFMGVIKYAGQYYFCDPARLGIIRTAPGSFCYKGVWYLVKPGGNGALYKERTKAELLALMDKAPGWKTLTAFNTSYVLNKTAKGKALLSYVAGLQKNYKVAILMVDLNTGQGISLRAGDRMYAASALKGPFVAMINRSYPARANQYRNLEYAAVVRSDNAAYRSLWASFNGYTFMGSIVRQCGATSWDGQRFPYIKPRDLGKLWVETYWFFYRSTNSNSAYVRSLYTHGTESFLYRGLKGRWTVNAKPGWMIGYGYKAQDDAGIVRAKIGGADYPYLVVVMTNAYGQHAKLQKLVQLIDDVHTDMINSQK